MLISNVLLSTGNVLSGYVLSLGNALISNMGFGNMRSGPKEYSKQLGIEDVTHEFPGYLIMCRRSGERSPDEVDGGEVEEPADDEGREHGYIGRPQRGNEIEQFLQQTMWHTQLGQWVSHKSSQLLFCMET